MKSDQISKTAAFIAIKFYGLTRIAPYRSWFDEEIIRFYDQMVQFLPSPLHWYHPMLKNRMLRKLFITAEELLLPGDLMHIIMRKHFISQKAQRNLSGNYEQLLVLGGGFDHLAAFHARQDVPSFEIDAPRMAALKRDFVREHGWNHPNLHINDNTQPSKRSSLDLRKIVDLDPDRDTLIVTEGFFDYLEPGHARHILEGLASFFNGDILLISTIFALDELSRFRRAVFKMGVLMVNEHIQLGLSKKEFDDLLQSTGFSQAAAALTASRMKQEILVPHNISMPVLDGFYLSAYEKT